MYRRKFLATSSALLSLGIAGCLAGADGTDKTQNKTVSDEAQNQAGKVQLKRIRIENHSGKQTLFNVDLARNGDHPYHSQLDIGPNETVTISDWTQTGRTFTAVGMSKRFGNYEMVAVNSAEEQSMKTLEIHFTIDEQGDVAGTVKPISDSNA
ncbi:hypothetical protein SAMN04487950_3334 [Halogranum rubrum]|uniref:Uncharacterized protein n=1 Tax=Halogranum rubrum TaxID=553466 RepID=A0A1I4GQ01_9EURY|nr:hypothetical protein [Halogranum rubrum]SFL32098.1 hypothetical protein SAMN04487950_3334 [Halogranum rubrum]